MIKMLRNTVDKKDAKYQITQWIQNDSKVYQHQLQNLTDYDIRKLVDYIAKDVRNEFQKVLNTDIDNQSNLELLKEIMCYINLSKINWHWEWNSKKKVYELKLGEKKTKWVNTNFEYEMEINDDYYLINPFRFVWKSDVVEIALKVINNQSDWFFSNKPVSELKVSQQILNEIKAAIIFEFKSISENLCTVIQKQNLVELQH